MTPYVRSVVLSFALVSLIAFNVIYLLAWSPWYTLSSQMFFIIVPGLCLVSGASGGASLKRGRRAAIGFGVGFLLLPVIMSLLVAVAALALEDARELVALPVLMFIVGVPFCLAGLIGGLSLGRGSVVAASAGGFGGGGAIGGALFWLGYWLSSTFYPADQVLVELLAYLGAAVGLLVPPLVGSIVLGRAAEKLAIHQEVVSTSSAKDA